MPEISLHTHQRRPAHADRARRGVAEVDAAAPHEGLAVIDAQRMWLSRLGSDPPIIAHEPVYAQVTGVNFMPIGD